MKETMDGLNLEIITLPLDQWKEYKEIRLRSLQNNPQAFAQTYAKVLEWPDEKWQERLQRVIDGESWMLFAKLDGKIVGMVGGYWDEEAGEKQRVEVISMYVDPKARGKGIARVLLNKVLEEFRKNGNFSVAGLGVSVNQKAARRLYESLGFKVVGSEQRVLGDGRSWEVLQMERNLNVKD